MSRPRPPAAGSTAGFLTYVKTNLNSSGLKNSTTAKVCYTDVDGNGAPTRGDSITVTLTSPFNITGVLGINPRLRAAERCDWSRRTRHGSGSIPRRTNADEGALARRARPGPDPRVGDARGHLVHGGLSSWTSATGGSIGVTSKPEVDAAALATSSDAFTNCFLNATTANAAIRTTALQYAGDQTRDPATADAQVTPDNRVHVVLNSDDYWPTATADGWVNAADPKAPCKTKYIDVKATDESVPGFYRAPASRCFPTSRLTLEQRFTRRVR